MSRLTEFIRRSFAEFLGIPTLVIVGFLLLTALMYWLDRSDLAVLSTTRDALGQLVFGNPDATRSLLGTLAASLVTLTSITFSLLLIALQQAAASMTHAIVDQFLRRRANQAFFGFFVGLALFALIILSATGPDFNPVLSASLALLLGMASLFLLIVLIYTTIHQVRPAVVVEAIHDHTIAAHRRHQRLVRRTHPAVTRAEEPMPLAADDDGFVVAIDVDAMQAAIGDHDVEVEVRAAVGAFVAYGDVVATVRGDTLDDETRRRIRDAFVLDRVRDLANDPAFGIEELVNIAWTSISTSKQNPAPGRLVIFALRDLLARWSTTTDGDADGDQDGQEPLPLVYRANLVGDVLDALELMAVVCSESMQAQNATAVIETLGRLQPRLAPEAQHRVADVSMRILAGLGDHVLTAPLEASLEELATTLAVTHPAEATAVRRAAEAMARSNGTLNARATRVPKS